MATVASFALGLKDQKSIDAFTSELAKSGTGASKIRSYKDQETGQSFVAISWNKKKVDLGFSEQPGSHLVNIDTRPDESKCNTKYSHLITVQPDGSVKIRGEVVPVLCTPDLIGPNTTICQDTCCDGLDILDEEDAPLYMRFQQDQKLPNGEWDTIVKGPSLVPFGHITGQDDASGRWAIRTGREVDSSAAPTLDGLNIKPAFSQSHATTAGEPTV